LEFWSVDLNPNIPTTKALSPAKTIDEHNREMLALYTRRIEADPQDAYAYSRRAHYYDCLHERDKAIADMRRWSVIMIGGTSSDSQITKSQKIRRILNGPFGYQLVFSAERPVNEIPLLNVAFGQKPPGSFVQPGCDSSTKRAKKGRCYMKSFQIPMLSNRGLAMSLFGLCLLSGLDAPPARADFTFGEHVNLKSVIPGLDPAHECIECFSYDGLEIYFTSDVPGGQGGFDLGVMRRASVDEDWGLPENLGKVVNSPNPDYCASISSDGLTLYFTSDRPGTYGYTDIWITTRSSRNDPWGQAVNAGPKINTSAGDGGPWISPDGLELYFDSGRPGGYGISDIYVARRATKNDPWDDPVNLGPMVNSPYYDGWLSLSPDGLLLLFAEYPDKIRQVGMVLAICG